MPEVVAIALSGGVDSLVSAALLKDQGYLPIGVHFLTGYEALTPSESEKDSKMQRVLQAERRLAPIARQLHIPLHIFDLQSDFQRHVVDYFISEYRNGKTPNPCLVCNPKIKFDLLLQGAQSLGATSIATGHYARILSDAGASRRLLCGVDGLKDQSYFLARLTPQQLKHAVLPLGGMTKSQVRRIAAAKGLHPAVERESQDVCFIASSGYGAFLSGQPGFEPRPGPIETVAGEVIGCHNGIHLFTIGQRKGINCPAPAPYYVVRIVPERNCIVVGFKKDLFSADCRVAQINWIVSPPREAIHVMVKVRYRHAAVPATLIPTDAMCARIMFDSPLSAVTPGQGAVFYAGEEVLGGGWIQ